MDFRTCTAQVFFQIPWKIWSNLKRIQQNAEIELMKLNYIPRFMGEYFMCHKFEMQHIKSVHRREKEKWQWKRKIQTWTFLYKCMKIQLIKIHILANKSYYERPKVNPWSEKCWIKYVFSIFLHLERGNEISLRRPYIHIIIQPIFDLKNWWISFK